MNTPVIDALLASDAKGSSGFVKRDPYNERLINNFHMSNTGHCGICGKQQKLTKQQKMVDHGFQISDGVHYFGYRAGHCFGVGYAPYQLSKEANIEFKKYLQEYLAKTQKNLTELKSGNVTSVQASKQVRSGFSYKTEYVTINKGEPGFEQELQTLVMRAEQQESTIKSDIKVNDSKIAKWSLQPLPTDQVLSIF